MIPQFEIKEKFLELCNQVEMMLKLIEEGFKRDNLESLKKAETIGEKLDVTSLELTKYLVEERADKYVQPFISIPGNLERIGDDMDSLVNCIRTKIKNNIMFSERAVSEVIKLLEITMGLLTCTGDCIITRNKILSTYIEKEGKKLGKLAIEYATFHEERLLSGTCIPKSAPIFLDILDSLRNISWHLCEIAKKSY